MWKRKIAGHSFANIFTLSKELKQQGLYFGASWVWVISGGNFTLSADH